MLATSTHLLSWVAVNSTPAHPQGAFFRYHMPESTCLELTDRFHSDTALSWRKVDTRTVRRYTRQSFDAWQSNTLLQFVPLEDASLADLTIRIDRPGEFQTNSQLAQAFRGRENGAALVIISREACWYSDRTFCLSVSKHKMFIEVTLLTTFLSSCVAVFYMVLTTPSSPRKASEGSLRGPSSVQPLLFFAAVWPAELLRPRDASCTR